MFEGSPRVTLPFGEHMLTEIERLVLRGEMPERWMFSPDGEVVVRHDGTHSHMGAFWPLLWCQHLFDRAYFEVVFRIREKHINFETFRDDGCGYLFVRGVQPEKGIDWGQNRPGSSFRLVVGPALCWPELTPKWRSTEDLQSIFFAFQAEEFAPLVVVGIPPRVVNCEPIGVRSGATKLLIRLSAADPSCVEWRIARDLEVAPEEWDSISRAVDASFTALILE